MSLRVPLFQSCAKIRAIIIIAILIIRGQRQRLKMEVETTRGECSSIVAMINTNIRCRAKISSQAIHHGLRL